MSDPPASGGRPPSTAREGPEGDEEPSPGEAPPDAGDDGVAAGEGAAEGAPEGGDGPGGDAPEDGESTSGGIGAGVILLGIVLLVVVTMANLAFAADATVLDEDHVVETMDDEGVYADIADQAQDRTVEGINDSIDDQQREFLPPDTDEQIEEIAADAVTESYIRDEVERNIDNFYAYLRDEESDVHLAINLTEPEAEIITRIEEEGLDQYIDTAAVRNELPDEQTLTPNGEPPDGSDSAGTVVSIIGWLKILLPVLALVLIGGIYLVTDSIQRTANTSGAAFLVAGVIGLVVGYGGGGIAGDQVESAIAPEDETAATFAEGFVAVVESLLGTIGFQSLILTVAGIVLMGLVYADRGGYLDGLKGDGEEPAEQGQYQQGQQPGHQQGGQDQYQQQKYQQGGQGQYQQGGQGQYQQGGQGQYPHGGQGQPGQQGGSDDLYYDPEDEGDAGNDDH